MCGRFITMLTSSTMHLAGPAVGKLIKVSKTDGIMQHHNVHPNNAGLWQLPS